MQDFLYVKDGGNYVQVYFSEILYIQAEDKYTTLMVPKGKYLILQTLNNIEKALPSAIFCRIHRSYIISLLHTKKFDANTAFVGDKCLPIGKRYKGVLTERVLVFSNGPSPFIKLSNYDILKFFGISGPN